MAPPTTCRRKPVQCQLSVNSVSSTIFADVLSPYNFMILPVLHTSKQISSTELRSSAKSLEKDHDKPELLVS